MVKTFRKKSTRGLASRLKVLETKQKADDKSSERKVQYYQTPTFLNNIWSANNNFIIRTVKGLNASGNTSAGETRIGNTINLRSSVIRFRASFPKNTDGVLTESSNYGTMVRVLLVDNLTDSTALTATDILQVPSYPLTSTYKNSIASGKRYKVLMDKKFAMTSEKPDVIFNYKMKLPKSGRVIHYNANDQNPSDFNVSLIYYATDISPLSPNQPILQYMVKSRFEDN